MNGFFQKDIISIRDLGKEDLETIFSATEKIIDLDPNERRDCKGQNTWISLL